jgi:NitT/TauT family transport system substrate-binding protein
MTVARYYWPGEYWVDIAAEKGWFKEARLDVRLVDTNADYFASLADTAEGGLDTNAFPFYDFVVTAPRADLVGVLVTDISNGADGVVGRRGLRSLRDLRGKRLALSRGTYLEYLVDSILPEHGLRLDDIAILDVPGEKAPGLLAAGKADAFASWEPALSEAEASGGVRLFDTSRLPGLNGAVQAFKRRFIDERPDEAFAVVARSTPTSCC